MDERDGVIVGLTCECGHDFDVGIGGVELESFRFTCPACGKEDGFSQKDIKAFQSAHAQSGQLIDDVLTGKRKL